MGLMCLNRDCLKINWKNCYTLGVIQTTDRKDRLQYVLDRRQRRPTHTVFLGANGSRERQKKQTYYGRQMICFTRRRWKSATLLYG